MAGLSPDQAVKILGWELTQLQLLENPTSTLTDKEATRLADVYHVNVPWLRGEVPLRDYDAVKDAIVCRDRDHKHDEMTFHDRDIIAEFAASMSRKPTKTLEQIAAEKDKK